MSNAMFSFTTCIRDRGFYLRSGGVSCNYFAWWNSMTPWLRASIRPWKVPLLNEIDVFCSLCILLLLLVGAQLPIGTEAERLRSVAESYTVTQKAR